MLVENKLSHAFTFRVTWSLHWKTIACRNRFVQRKSNNNLFEADDPIIIVFLEEACMLY